MLSDNLWRTISCVCFASMLLASGVLAEEPNRDSFALLVGADRYPSLGARQQLEGARNDVDLMRSVLRARFNIPSNNIFTLTGWDDSEEQFAPGSQAVAQPSYANICAALDHLAALAASGKAKRVIVLMSGHGDRVPATVRDGNIEPDGMDEIFVPPDFGAWDEQRQVFGNVIYDNQIGEWLTAITEHGATAWLMFDSCHSGTMSRTVGVEETARTLGGDALGIPESAWDAALGRSRAAKAAPGERDSPRGGGELDLSETGRIIAFYAANAHEFALELPLPAGAPSGAQKRHGLLTYCVAAALERCNSAITFGELMALVRTGYSRERHNATFPTPFVEGAAQRLVFGEGTRPAVPTIRLSRVTTDTGSTQYQIDAGALSGIQVGTVLRARVATRPQSANEAAPHVRVTKVQPTYSIVRPEAPRQGARAEPLPELARCEVVKAPLGELQVPTAIIGESVPREALLSAAKRVGLERFGRIVEAVADAEVVIRLADQQAKFFVKPKKHELCSTETRAFSSFATGDTRVAASELVNRLQRVFAHRNLSQVAGQMADVGARGLRLEVLRVLPDGRTTPADGTWIVDEKVAIRVANDSEHPLEYVLFYLDDGFGITRVPMPSPSILGPGDSVELRPPLVVKNPTRAREYLVAVAAPNSTRTPQLNLHFFVQSPLELDSATPTAALPEATTRSGGESPLTRLLEAVTRGTRSTFDTNALQRSESLIAVFSWHSRSRGLPAHDR